MIRILIATLVVSLPTLILAADPAAVPPACTGSATLGTFQLSVRPFSQGSPLPLKEVAAVPAGSRLIWSPAHLKLPPSNNAEVTAVLVPAGDASLITLEPRKASERAEWQLLQKPLVIALVYGPQGLSEGKVQALVTRNQDLLRQLADYAEQSSEVESLVQELADAEQSRAGADSALRGLSAQYGVSAQKLNAATTSDQQAALLLKALIPASNNYDPLATQSAQVQQSGGLAASVAGMFFGSYVGLAAGGVALFANLKTVAFPNTEFRSAFAQTSGKDNLALCTKNQTAKSKTRTAYLWAYRVPQSSLPTLSLAGTPNLPLGTKSTVELKFGKGSAAKDLALVRDWRLLSNDMPATSIAATVTPAGAVELDLSKAKLAAGDYQLAATWDWDTVPVSGTIHLHPISDLAHITFAKGQRDKLVEGRGAVPVELSGPDFEFLESVVLEPAAKDGKPAEVPFALPLGKRAGSQNEVVLNVDTAKAGTFQLAFTQSDGIAHKLPITVLPPNPKLSHLPVRFNQGETSEPLVLQGSGVERIEAVTSEAGEITGAVDSGTWTGEIHLKSALKKGQSFPILLKVAGLDNPITVLHAIEIVGARPKIVSLRKSQASTLSVEIAADELPAGTAAGLVLTLDQLRDSARPQLELGCESGELKAPVTLTTSASSNGASLSSAGPGALYLSVDPGAVSYPGCLLTATVIANSEGRSDPFVLGRVIRIPRLDKFTLSSEKVGADSYAGTVDGVDLDVIEKVGWDAANGIPVDAIPTPVVGEHPHQTLRLVLPWPAPSPHALLYIWLRGENQGRKTSVAY